MIYINNDIFKPSLKEDDFKNIESYDIRKLFYVAFFGGIIPLIALGSMNAKWLNIKNNIIYFLSGLGILVLILKFIFFGFISSDFISLDKNYIKWSYRILSIGIYGAYYLAMKEKFNQHMLLNGNLKPMFKTALLWIIIGVIVEASILFIIGLYVINFNK